jgi:hypothetical protein
MSQDRLATHPRPRVLGFTCQLQSLSKIQSVDREIYSIQGYYETYRISTWVLCGKVLHGISAGKRDHEKKVARSPTWTPMSVGAFQEMLQCDSRGTLIHGMTSNGHFKFGRPEILKSRKSRSRKPSSSDVAGSCSNPPTSMEMEPRMSTAKLGKDLISRSRDTLDSRLL